MSTTHPGARSDVTKWVLTGAMMGILAGIVFILFEMIVALAMQGSAFGPVRMISAIPLGKEALPKGPTVGPGTALPVGFVVHFVLSMIFGGTFGAIVAFVRPLRTSPWALVGAATVAGFALWIVNFYVIGSWAFPWFLTANQFVQGFLAHTFFYGTPLGLLLMGWVGSERR